jgi:FdhD protein
LLLGGDMFASSLSSSVDDLPEASRVVRATGLRNGLSAAIDECVAEEVAVALEVNGIAHAVMLATPADLDDFALGFLLSEGIVDSRRDLLDVDPVPVEGGIALRAEIAQRCLCRLKQRRRALAGRTGCGLCGTESIADALRPIRGDVARVEVDAAAIARGMRALAAGQALQRMTGATHAAAWVSLDGKLATVREDVGRHNALDKLIGALARAGFDPAAGFVAVTSRASYEMVHKTASAGIGLLAAISAPTALAIRIAEQAGLVLAGFVRGDNAALYSHAGRVGGR